MPVYVCPLKVETGGDGIGGGSITTLRHDSVQAGSGFMPGSVDLGQVSYEKALAKVHKVPSTDEMNAAIASLHQEVGQAEATLQASNDKLRSDLEQKFIDQTVKALQQLPPDLKELVVAELKPVLIAELKSFLDQKFEEPRQQLLTA